MIHRHHGDSVLGVWLQVLQNGGGGGSRHLVLVEEKGDSFKLGELLEFGELLEKPNPRKE